MPVPAVGGGVAMRRPHHVAILAKYTTVAIPMAGVNGVSPAAAAGGTRRQHARNFMARLSSGFQWPQSVSVSHICGSKFCVNPSHVRCAATIYSLARPSMLSPARLPSLAARVGAAR